jgi:hypothetical protein
MEEEIKEATVVFEALKSRMYQNKDGHYLTLKIHRDDVPEEVIRDDINCRYYVTLTPIGDDERPAPHRVRSRGETVVAEAGKFARSKDFQNFLVDANYITKDDLDTINSEAIYPTSEEYEEDITAQFLRSHLKISSRAELKSNKEALKEWENLRSEYDEWRFAIRN